MKRMISILTVLVLANFALAQTVTFQVNMSVMAKKGNFNVATDTVKLAGTMNSWNPFADVMTKGANDTIYSITKTLTTGDNLEFKFIKGGTDWESTSNRTYTVPAGNSTISFWFNNDSVYVPSVPKPFTLNFRANMEFEKVSGRFNPATDTMTVRGDFNGWGSTTVLNPSPTNANIYVGTFQDTLAIGDVVNYKFAFMGTNGTTWENGDNRLYSVTDADYNAGFGVLARTFNDLTLNTITNAPVTITFMVNVDTARSSVTSQPFSSVDNVVMAGANAPLAWPLAGWPDADSGLVKKMYNDGTHGDSVANDKWWSLALTFPQYSPLTIEYKYGANWGLPSNTGSNDNESSVGTNHLITLLPTLLTASVRNNWSQMGNVPLYNIVTGIKEIGSGIPNNYSLDQNYPNPFNPTTNIRFNMPQAGTVTLKIFNVLGQEVATLLNEFRNAGSYEYTFDASNLNTGVYFYSITTNNFTSTKKMLLVK